ncbi:zinc finger protein 800-like [Tachypleus tridentatus]|uniref:zinc finger protein 800-like n=1 Tax=Tachypleus tridentatus TaxID=6853 RepID=UPI003FD11D25
MENKKQDENFSRYSGVTMKIENEKVPVNCEELDHSVLQTPLNLGIRNIQQVLKCLESGTKEVKDIILNECTIIYECKVCQNMFRSLENLLAHKRFYCKIHMCDSVFFLLENSPKETVTVEPESPREENCNHPDVDCTSHNINFADHIKNASEEPVIQISVPKMHTPTIETKDISKSLPNKSHQDQNNTLLKDDKEQHSLTTDSSIQPVFENSDVVLHTSRTDETMDNQLSEELQKIPDERDLSVTKQDITVITDMSSSANAAKEKKELLDCFVRQRPSTSRAKQLASRTDCNVRTLSCLRCETRYASINTLYYHMTRIHAEKRTVYPCMLCGSTFVQVWGLTRHLIYSHQKTKAQVKELKKQIKCLSYQKNNKVNERNEKTFGTFCNTNNKNKELQLHTSSKHETKCTCKFSQDSHQLYFDCQLESTAGKTDKKIKPADGISEVPNVISRPKRVAEKKMPKDFVNSQTLFSRNSKIDKISPTKISSVKDSEKLVDFKNIFCKKCHKYFSSVSSLKRHVAVHAGVRRFKCKLCSYLSYAKSDCRTHIIRMHNKPNTTTVWVEKQILDL